MISDHVVLLADILRRCHGGEAELVARWRAGRCAHQQQGDWATKWAAVADHLAHEMIALEKAD